MDLPGTGEGLWSTVMVGVIAIDGASSAGRTSLARRFEQRSSGRYRAYHLDEFVRDVPRDVWDRCSGTHAGWDELARSFNAFLHAESPADVGIVADCLFLLDGAREHLFSLFGRDRVFYVQLYCALDELERRERSRKDRRRGLARSQFDAVYAFEGYDFRIDATERSTDECAALLETALGVVVPRQATSPGGW